VVGVWAMVTPWAMLGESFGIRGVATVVCGVAATLITAAMIGGMIHDCIIHWQKPSV